MGPRFFLPLLVRIAVVTAGPLAVAWWLAGPLAGVGAGAVALALELWRIDRAVRTGVDDRVSYDTAAPPDLTWLDEDTIRTALAALRRIDFRPIADCAFTLPGSPPGFARVLVHPHQRVYAQVTQTRRGLHQPGPVTIGLLSLLADGRTLSTSSGAPHPTMAFGLGIVDAWQIRPGASAHDLMVAHLSARAEMMAAGNTAIAGDGTLEGFVAAQSDLYGRQAQVCRTGGALRAIARGLRWERGGNLTWRNGMLATAPAIAVPVSAPIPPPPAAPPPPPSPVATTPPPAQRRPATPPAPTTNTRPATVADRGRAQSGPPAARQADPTQVSSATT